MRIERKSLREIILIIINKRKRVNLLMSSALNLEDDRYDDMFLQIVTQIGKGPQGLLGATLGFLKRRTDFFYEAEPGDKMGFPPGYGESMVRASS